MSAYIVAEVIVSDAEKMAQYREWSTRAMQEHGARILVRGGAVEVMEGSWNPSRLVILEFANREAAHAFYDSQTYRHARSIRQDAGEMRMALVDGV